ncbi:MULTISPECIES: DEAD/DEAH box helicase family protein [unclassified Kitasatospora]|uniref:DEAD/DEAH box helicase family protein n=1 Tax=unclassified Kitasatospora TaxID=2633591 RepID=UPI0033D4A565
MLRARRARAAGGGSPDSGRCCQTRPRNGRVVSTPAAGRQRAVRCPQLCRSTGSLVSSGKIRRCGEPAGPWRPWTGVERVRGRRRAEGPTDARGLPVPAPTPLRAPVRGRGPVTGGGEGGYEGSGLRAGRRREIAGAAARNGRVVSTKRRGQHGQAPGGAEAGGRVRARVSTKAPRIADLVAAARPGEPVTVYATYASLERIVQAQGECGLPAWDLVVVDEAHRTAGSQGKAWAAVHDDAQVPAARRLYFTATPRIPDDRTAKDGLADLTDTLVGKRLLLSPRYGCGVRGGVPRPGRSGRRWRAAWRSVRGGRRSRRGGS